MPFQPKVPKFTLSRGEIRALKKTASSNSEKPSRKARRAQAILDWCQGKNSILKISKSLRMGRSTVRRWLSRAASCKEKGLRLTSVLDDAVEGERPRGRPKLVTPEIGEAILEFFKRGHKKAGLDTSTWFVPGYQGDENMFYPLCQEYLDEKFKEKFHATRKLCQRHLIGKTSIKEVLKKNGITFRTRPPAKEHHLE
jgi:transposase